ncbi:MAG TPA: maleylpyruvate isomerase N-terminal domain-containing protein [Streptosporangiaceae bacterium]|nr:maleylpyruvate isomerase N-terminal domain-containing protein [Streptosporangiaceae bacterium]
MVPEQFVRALDCFEVAVAAVPSDRWDAPSPCEGWSAADVVGHVVGGLRTIRLLGGGGSSTDEAVAPRSAAGADPLTPWRAARTALLASLDDAALARQVSLPWGARMPLGE